MKSLRIAMINTSRGWGGAEEQMLALSRELLRRGHAVSVVARAGGPVHGEFGREGIPVLPVARTGFRVPWALWNAAVRIRKPPPDILHSHRDHDLPLGKLLSLSSGAPLLLTQHCRPSRPSALVYGSAVRIVTVSAYIADAVRAALPTLAGRVQVVFNGIDPERFSSPDREYWRLRPDVSDRSPLLGCVGAFYKGQEALIAMMPGLRAEFPRIALLLIGEDEGRKRPLRELAERLGVADAVIFTGRVPRERLKDALAGLDLNVSAFRNEGFGLSVVEGLAVGTPFVGCRAGGYPEIVREPADGVLVDAPERLAGAVASLLRDREIRAGLRAGGPPRVPDRFTLAAMTDAYEAIYRGLRGGK